ncbi:hypothetical protein Ahia01_000360100 [Argonauta hians]
MITAANDRRSITRNSSLFKKVPANIQNLCFDFENLENDQRLSPDTNRHTADAPHYQETQDQHPRQHDSPVQRKSTEMPHSPKMQDPHPQRKSTRIRNPPTKLKDYIC